MSISKTHNTYKNLVLEIIYNRKYIQILLYKFYMRRDGTLGQGISQKIIQKGKISKSISKPQNLKI